MSAVVINNFFAKGQLNRTVPTFSQLGTYPNKDLKFKII